MLPHRAAVLAAVAISSLAVTACGPSSGGDAAKPRSQMPSAAAINAAIGDLARSSYAVEITSSGSGLESGTVDPAARTGTLNSKASMQGVPAEMDAVMISPDIWVRLDLGDRNDEYGIASQSWMKLDFAKVSGDPALPLDLDDFSDALDMKKLLAGVDAKRSDPNHFTGVIDLTRASGVSAPVASDIAAAGEKAHRVPISVAVDHQGRLTEVNIDGGPIHPGLAVDIRFSDYGTAAPVTRPDDNQIVPTPASVYQLLSGRSSN